MALSARPQLKTSPALADVTALGVRDCRSITALTWNYSMLALDVIEDHPVHILCYVHTALHQAVTPNADFQFVNIGRWQSAEEFQAATQSPGFRESAAGLAGYRPHPGLYRVVRT
jgi:hypothetical protein